MKMPRIECEYCSRSIAAGMVAGRPSKGRLWRHDPPERPKAYGDALVSCTGSLAIVDLKVPGAQMELGQDDSELDQDQGAPDGPLGTVALF
ncbi:hypothetical protein [Streptomyces sp. NPDC059466]|uniref:hypothetical protein n=1 Tax=unclassified Streptomyces TaxID=2593676 RepID=UPI0036A2C301